VLTLGRVAHTWEEVGGVYVYVSYVTVYVYLDPTAVSSAQTAVGGCGAFGGSCKLEVDVTLLSSTLAECAPQHENHPAPQHERKKTATIGMSAYWYVQYVQYMKTLT